ncbi:MAG: YfiR family protein [Acidobacteriia bacterium]|nr:YfiR family protein [Terriglobia bacterium]
MPRVAPKQRLASRALVYIELFAGLLFAPLCSGADVSLEYSVKAAFLLNFTKFIEWPATAFANQQAPFEICILGKDPFGGVIDQIVLGEMAGNRALIVRRLGEASVPQTCELLYVGPELKDTAQTLSELPPGILTVGEGNRFLRAGGMIAFVIDDRRVRFDISQGAAEKAGLKLSAKLLTVARLVSR